MTNAKTQTFQVNYNYAADNGQLRTGSFIVTTSSTEEAKKLAIHNLQEDHTYFRITKVKTVKSDNPQQNL